MIKQNWDVFPSASSSLSMKAKVKAAAKPATKQKKQKTQVNGVKAGPKRKIQKTQKARK